MSDDPTQPPAGHPTWQTRAIQAVGMFDPDLTRVGVAHLLSMWRHANQLTYEQARAVVAHFAAQALETTQPLGRTPLTPEQAGGLAEPGADTLPRCGTCGERLASDGAHDLVPPAGHPCHGGGE